MTNWNTLEKELLSNLKVKKEFDRLSPRYAIISELIASRIKKGITQESIAKKMGTKQSAIARIESGSVNPTLDFLQKFAHAMDLRLSIRLV